eukprot:12184210-Alexandrium_andersonii.AAC.1
MRSRAFDSCWVVCEDTVAGLDQGRWAFPPGPRQFATVAGKNGRDVRVSPLVTRATLGRSIPWVMIGRLGRPLNAAES